MLLIMIMIRLMMMMLLLLMMMMMLLQMMIIDHGYDDNASERMSPRLCHRPRPLFLRTPCHQVKSQFFPLSAVEDTRHNDDVEKSVDC